MAPNTLHSCGRLQGHEFERILERVVQNDQSDFFVSIISFHEQVLGWHNYIAKTKQGADMVVGYGRFEDLLIEFGRYQVRTFHMAAADVYEDFDRVARVGAMDLRIAAIAVADGLTLLTANSQSDDRRLETSVERYLASRLATRIENFNNCLVRLLSTIHWKHRSLDILLTSDPIKSIDELVCLLVRNFEFGGRAMVLVKQLLHQPVDNFVTTTCFGLFDELKDQFLSTKTWIQVVVCHNSTPSSRVCFAALCIPILCDSLRVSR